MVMRLPKDPDSWTTAHVDGAIAHALKLHRRWEKRVDLHNREHTDKLYREYQLASELALNLARYVGWRVGDAEVLP
jgi:hypothetical protein